MSVLFAFHVPHIASSEALVVKVGSCVASLCNSEQGKKKGLQSLAASGSGKQREAKRTIAP